jgi:hypothetical protein
MGKQPTQTNNEAGRFLYEYEPGELLESFIIAP